MNIETILAEQIQATLTETGLDVDLIQMRSTSHAKDAIKHWITLKWTITHTVGRIGSVRSQNATIHKIDFLQDHAKYKTEPKNGLTKAEHDFYGTKTGNKWEYANPQFPQNLIDHILK